MTLGPESPPFPPRALAALGSLRLTVGLLAAAAGLLVAGTLAQARQGLWSVQAEYFHAWVVYVRGGGFAVPVFPGGRTLGLVLLANLGATAVRGRGRGGAGLRLVHLGVLLLLAGALLSGILRTEYRLHLTPGEPAAALELPGELELAVREAADPRAPAVLVRPLAELWPGVELSASNLPFTATVLALAPHARLVPRGPGLEPGFVPLPPARGPEERHHPAVRLALSGAQGETREVVISTELPDPRTFVSGGRAWTVGFRPRRVSQSWELTLRTLEREWHEGTRIERASRARLQLRPAGAGSGHEVVVAPNVPLRHAGLTFYLDGPAPSGRGVILQVVSDPAGWIPYAAGVLLAGGLLLTAVGRLRCAAPPRPAPAALRRREGGIAVWVLLGLGVVGAWSLRPPAAPGGFDLAAWGSLPVLERGREKPLDTVARSSLLLLQGRQSLRGPGREPESVRGPGGEPESSRGLVREPDSSCGLGHEPESSCGLGREPVERLLDVLYRPERAERWPVFALRHPELRGLLGLPLQGEASQALVAFRHRLPELEMAAQRAAEVPRAERSAFEEAVLRLRDGVRWHRGLAASATAPGNPGLLPELIVPRAASGEIPAPEVLRPLLVMDEYAVLRLIPPGAEGEGWRSLATAWRGTLATGQVDALAAAHAAIGRAWRDQNPTAFNVAVRAASTAVQTKSPELARRVAFEARLNAAAPLDSALVLCVLALVVAAVAWRRPGGCAAAGAFAAAILAFLLLTGGLAARMWLERRPPVTNLHSSALFVGWITLAVALGLEHRRRDGLGAALAGVLGAGCLGIAHHLALAGDTLEVMRAVLNANLWLATHVVAMSVGYAATLFAGCLGIATLLRDLVRRERGADERLHRTLVGVTGLALGANVLGTFLGGVWADQAWGRFWGWDPKENGALLLVLWNALLLHARAAGLAGPRGCALLAVGGNVVTAGSWFGVNLLGVGLHQYGGQGAAAWPLAGFTLLHGAVLLSALRRPRPVAQAARVDGQAVRSVPAPTA
jgi:ABC-type transport system involved in cytochrome c biogenesis permease subunit